MTTKNLPAVIAPAPIAIPELGVGSRVRINNPDFPHLNGRLGLVTEHRPEREISNPGFFTFTALEDFAVALVRGDEIIELFFSRDELTNP